MQRCNSILLLITLLLLVNAPLRAQEKDASAEKAEKIHFASLVFDTHIDTPPRLQREGWKFTAEHSDNAVDLPRRKKGGLNALFFSIYMQDAITGPKAVNAALERIAAVHKLAEDLPDQVMLCLTAADVKRAHQQGKFCGH